MSGPPYPRYAPGFVPGSNAFGSFQFGISPFGILAQFDQWTTVINQYANSDRLMGIINSFNDAMDQTQNITNLYDMVWNVLTATTYGLDVWGRIVNVSRTLKLPANTDFFGFQEAGSWTGFGQGSFFSGGQTTSNFVLQDTDYRKLILAKAASNISDGSIPAVNQILLTLFHLRGKAFVQDNQNMSLTYVFDFVLNPIETAIVTETGILPSATGIIVNIQQI